MDAEVENDSLAKGDPGSQPNACPAITTSAVGREGSPSFAWRGIARDPKNGIEASTSLCCILHGFGPGLDLERFHNGNGIDDLSVFRLGF